MTGADVLVLDIMNQQMLDRFNTDAQSRSHRRRSARTGKVLAVGEGLLPKETLHRTRARVWDDGPARSGRTPGSRIRSALMKFALTQAGVTGLTIPDPQPSLDFGYYYPDGEQPVRCFARWDDFDAWRQAHGKTRPGAPRVAVGFFKSTYYAGETELLDALIAEIERQGAEAIPMFGYPGAVAHPAAARSTPRAAPRRRGARLPLQLPDPEASKLLAKVDIPVVNLVSLYGRSEKEWRASTTGMTCSKARSRWPCRSWPARSRRPSSAARKRSGMPRLG